MAVQFSIQKLVSDGTLSTFALGIQYLQRNDIYMRIAGEETPQSGAPSGYTWSFVDNTTLKILPVVPNGVEVVVYRRTDIDEMYNIYSQNAQFDEATIDENNQQLLYIAQEYLEQGIPGAGVDTIEFLRDDGINTYYRVRRTDGSYSDEFAVPSVGSTARIVAREAIRRSYAGAGYKLVPGSFQAGFTLVNTNDVALDEVTGRAFSGAAGTYPVNTPTTGFVDRSSELGGFVFVSNYGLVGLTDDTAVIQAAAIDAYAKGLPLVFTPLKYGMYRSHQILLPQNSSEPVKPLHIIGNGATIYILGTDHLFSVNGDFFYDLFVDGLHFESDFSGNFASTDSKIFNTKKLLRLIVTNCSSRYVNKFFDCPWVPPQTAADYAQSVYATNCIYRRGNTNGYFFQAPVAFDVSLTDCLVEQSYNGIRVVSQPAVGNLQQVSSVRIRGGAWESLFGTAMAFGPVHQLSINGVYFEGNTMDINLAYNGGEAPHLGIDIQGNDFYLTPAQISSGYFPIIWGASASKSYKTGGNKSNGNLHDINGASGVFDFTGDSAANNLYNGMNANNPRATTNSPTGKVKFADNTGSWFFNDLTLVREDIILGGTESGKIGNADLVGGLRVWPKSTTGALNPQASPSTYGNAVWCKGSYVRNTAPTILGTVGSQYVISGWLCVTSGTGGQAGTDRWVETRNFIGA